MTARGRAGVATFSGRRVSRLAAARRSPWSSVERLAVAMLERDAPLPIEDLVERVAQALYTEALRHGAWTVDIGVVGAEAFAPDVAEEIEAGDGTLWRIEPPEGARR